MLKTVGAVGETSKAVAAVDFLLQAEWKKRGKKVGIASTLFPLLFHRGNLETHCGTSAIRSTSTTSTKLNPSTPIRNYPYQTSKSHRCPCVPLSPLG